MTAFFLIILFVPLLVASAAYIFLNGITWKEFGIIVVAQMVVAGSSAAICSCANTADVEVWNGRVTKKYSEHVSCSHSYPCNCVTTTTGSGNNQTTTTTCDTCYEHIYDVDWQVDTSNGEEFAIDRVNRQGTDEPPRWSSIKMGEPTSRTHSYKNYVKAAPGTLFLHQGLKEKYMGNLPVYPQRVHDYYHLNRLVTVGMTMSEGGWNEALSELNADLGRAKQANIIIVVVKNMPADYYYALEEYWVGGKKNDVVLVVSVDADMKPQWATVMCWTTSEIFKIKLRDDVMNDPFITKDAVINDLKMNVDKYFVRKPMKDFEYLETSIVPSTTERVITMIVGLLVACGLIVFFQQNDVFNEEERHNGIWADVSTLSNPFGDNPFRKMQKRPKFRSRRRFG